MAIMVRALAEDVAKIVRTTSRIGDSAPGEHYVDKIEATTVRGRIRWIGRVNAFKFTSHWLEFGTRRMRAQAPLRRSLEKLGLRTSIRRRGDIGDE